MARYIDAEKIDFRIPYYPDEEGCDALVSIKTVKRCIDMTPTEDVAPIVRCKDCEKYDRMSENISESSEGKRKHRGHFILFNPRRENRNATYGCSFCGKLCSSYYNDVGVWKYCPHCGIKMKGGAE